MWLVDHYLDLKLKKMVKLILLIEQLLNWPLSDAVGHNRRWEVATLGSNHQFVRNLKRSLGNRQSHKNGVKRMRVGPCARSSESCQITSPLHGKLPLIREDGFCYSPVNLRAHSRSLLHVLIHEYLRKNDKSWEDEFIWLPFWLTTKSWLEVIIACDCHVVPLQLIRTSTGESCYRAYLGNYMEYHVTSSKPSYFDKRLWIDGWGYRQTDWWTHGQSDILTEERTDRLTGWLYGCLGGGGEAGERVGWLTDWLAGCLGGGREGGLTADGGLFFLKWY